MIDVSDYYMVLFLYCKSRINIKHRKVTLTIRKETAIGLPSIDHSARSMLSRPLRLKWKWRHRWKSKDRLA